MTHLLFFYRRILMSSNCTTQQPVIIQQKCRKVAVQLVSDAFPDFNCLYVCNPYVSWELLRIVFAKIL